MTSGPVPAPAVTATAGAAPGPTATPAIQVEGLVKRYRKASRNAVDGISFEVGTGEFFVLLGPNGAGQDHHDLDPDHHADAHRWPGADRRPGHRHGGQRGPARGGDHLPAAQPGPEPDRRGERPLPRRPVRALPVRAVVAADAGRVPCPGGGAGRACSGWAPRSSHPCAPTPAGCAASWRSCGACSTGHASSSWTSPPPGWTRPTRQDAVGATSRGFGARAAPRSS